MKRPTKWRWLAGFTLAAMVAAVSAQAAVNVRVQPSGNTLASAYTLTNEQRTLFGNVEGATAYECMWDFSDGTPDTPWTAPSNTRYITVDHTFTSAAPHFARLTCRDPANHSDTDTATIEMLVLGTESSNRQKNSAIDNGLRYAYQRRNFTGTYKGCFYGSGSYTASTGMALLAFENHGHNLESPDEDIYKAMVVEGLQCLLDRYAQQVTMTDQTCIGDPETGDVDTGDPLKGPVPPTDNDNIGIRFQTYNQYYTPFGLMALVNSGSETTAKNTTVVSSNAVVNGQTLFDIAVDMKDYLSWSMTDINDCNRNGWRYSENYSSIDNSVSQWPALALFETELRWNIAVKPEVKNQYADWLAYSQHANGSFGYTSYSGYNNMAKTAAGVIGLNWLGKPESDTAVQNALTYMGTRYNTSGYGTWYGHWDHAYAMYGFYKAMKLYNKTFFTDSLAVVHDWEQEYQDFLADPALGNVKWHATYKASYFDLYFYAYDQAFDTYTALAMLAPEVAALPPVAEAGPDQNVLPVTQSAQFDGSGSFHQDSTKSLTKYEWDFDASDGLWWTSAATPPAGEGDIGLTSSHAYPDTGSAADYTVTLRVTDNGGTVANPDPVMTDTDTLNVHVETTQVPPVAVTNGPWAAIPGQAVTFDGSASFDPNAGPPLNDFIASYEWDLDGDGLWNEANGDDGTPVTAGDWSIVTKTYATPTSGLATLRVTDSFGAQDTSGAQFIAIGLAYVTGYQNCWSTQLSRTEIRYGIFITVENIGHALAENVVLTLTNVPTNRTIVADTSALGDLAPGAQAVTACDTAAKTSDIITDLNRRVIPTGDWIWKAEFDSGGTHYIIPNLPPLAP